MAKLWVTRHQYGRIITVACLFGVAQMRLATLSKIGGALLAVGFGVLVGINSHALSQLKVNGPVYERVIAGKDLIADILPPPAYVIEAFLEASLIARDPGAFESGRDALARARTDYNDRIAHWKGYNLPDSIKSELLGDVHREADHFWKIVESGLLPAVEAGDQERVGKEFSSLQGRFEAHRAAVRKLVASVEAMNKQIEADASLGERWFVSLTWIAAAIGILAAIGYPAGIHFLLLKPVLRVGAVMGLMSKGDLSVSIPGTGRHDEIGDIASAVVSFRDAGLQKLQMEADAKRAQAALDEERERVEKQRLDAVKEQERVVTNLGQALGKLAARDLTIKLIGFPEAYRQIEHDFNAAARALADAMKSVANDSATMIAGSDEITRAADDLARRTEQQAASLEEAAATLDEITATSSRAAEGAAHGREIARSAQSDAQAAGVVVGDTVSAMGTIERSAKQINQIIGVIDEIAFQTNLLALNAGVEAARAGDAGRGFAVVASEVRALAQRSAEAAKEIKALISASTEQVAGGVTLVARTGEVLERILKQVAEINLVMAGIASGAQEQATALREVNAAINQMDQMTQQNAAMVEQSTAASHSLRKDAQNLSRTIARFNIHGAGAAEELERTAATPALRLARAR